MMRRRAIPGRRGGVVGTVARTAVIAGTATVASNAVSGAMQNRSDQKAAQQDAEFTAQQQQLQSQQDVEQLKAQMAQLQAQEAASHMAPPAASQQTDLLGQLERLAQLRDSGVLSPQEFDTAKAKLLA